MFELKALHPEAVPAALERAERYRLLNEPVEAESICLDVLAIEPENQKALVTLLLALSDQFGERLGVAYRQASELVPRLADDYSRLYYQGILYERRAKSRLDLGGGGSGHGAYDWFRRAMECYDQAIEIRPPGNDEAILRWNTCARIIDRSPGLAPEPEDTFRPLLE